MSRVILGAICGLVFGAVDVGIMLPMTFPDKGAAITAAFIARFGIGFAIGAARLPWLRSGQKAPLWPPWLTLIAVLGCSRCNSHAAPLRVGAL